MPKYRKKPIEAVKWKGNNIDEIIEFLTDGLEKEFSFTFNYELERNDFIVKINPFAFEFDLYLKKDNNKKFVKIGDFIIKNPDNTFYSCESDTFNNNYEPIE